MQVRRTPRKKQSFYSFGICLMHIEARKKTFGAEDVRMCSWGRLHVQFSPTTCVSGARCTCRALLPRRRPRGPSQWPQP
eukprot:15009293-Alexandrium_andersonii.AAC.1